MSTCPRTFRRMSNTGVGLWGSPFYETCSHFFFINTWPKVLPHQGNPFSNCRSIPSSPCSPLYPAPLGFSGCNLAGNLPLTSLHKLGQIAGEADNGESHVYCHDDDVLGFDDAHVLIIFMVL